MFLKLYIQNKLTFITFWQILSYSALLIKGTEFLPKTLIFLIPTTRWRRSLVFQSKFEKFKVHTSGCKKIYIKNFSLWQNSVPLSKKNTYDILNYLKKAFKWKQKMASIFNNTKERLVQKLHYFKWKCSKITPILLQWQLNFKQILKEKDYKRKINNIMVRSWKKIQGIKQEKVLVDYLNLSTQTQKYIIENGKVQHLNIIFRLKKNVTCTV